MSASMDPKDFAKCLLVSLADENIAKAIGNIISKQLSAAVASLEKTLREKDKEIHSLKNRVVVLEDQLDGLEQYSRRNSVRISGVKEEPEEVIVTKTLALINDALTDEPQLTMADIDRVHRVGKPPASNASHNPPRKILVKFATHRNKERVLRANALLKNLMPGSTIYVNEDLTQERASILYKARQLKRNNKIKDCKTYDGRFVIKDKEKKIHSARTISETLKLLQTLDK